VGALNDKNSYGFAFGNVKGAKANDWAWPQLTAALQTTNPVVWSSDPSDGTTGHAMAAWGYRVIGSQRFVIVYNTWGTTAGQQYAEYGYDQWVHGGTAKSTGFGAITPGGPDLSGQAVLWSPRGGETVFGSSELRWEVWGSSIVSTNIGQSVDGGKTWSFVGVVPTHPGINTATWTPAAITNKGRVRVLCFDSNSRLVAADGSVRNVFFQPLPDLYPGGSAPYCNMNAQGELVVTVVNGGPVGAGTTTTQVTFSTPSGPKVVRVPTPAVAAGSSVDVTADIPADCWDGDCNFEIRVDVDGQVIEATEDNNFVSGACFG
jgi:hypothetical protein